MNAEAKQASLVIESVARAVANWAVDQHVEANPALPERYGATWRADWIDQTLSQVQLLAQAVAVRSTELYANSARWAYESFKARGVDPTDLVQNTRCLRDVLGKELPPAVGEVAIACVDAALVQLSKTHAPQDVEGPGETARSELVLKYLEAILGGDRATAESTMLATLTEGLAVPEIYEQVLAPAQARLGWMWHRGEITVADEHFGSATTQAVMSQLRPHFNPAAPNGRTVVATSTPGDLHEIGLRMVADCFEIDGWNVVYLGANTPTTDLIELLDRRRPDLLALAVSTSLTLRDAGELLERIRGTSSVAELKVLVGGPPFMIAPDLWRELGADGCATSSTEAVKLGNQIVAS